MPYGGYAYPEPSPQDELTALKQQAEYLENELSAIRRRIEELEKGQANK